MAWIDQTRRKHRVRLRAEDGTVITDSVHPDRDAAERRLKQVEGQQAADEFRDPRPGRILLCDWVQIWKDAHIAGPSKTATYNSHFKCHILPRFGTVPLKDVEHMHVKAFVKHLLAKPLAPSSAGDVLTLLSVLMRAAVIDKRIPSNPCEGVRIPNRGSPERPFLTPEELLQLVSRIRRREDRLLIITAAYTGMRWGELTGLTRHHVHLDEGFLVIDPKVGALHEVGSKMWLGPPKTPASARTVHLPPFLVDLLRRHLDGRRDDIVFVGARGKWLRRSAFGRRVFRPAADGSTAKNWAPLKTGLHFHDLRGTHNTWIDEDATREILMNYRMGHKTKGVKGRYRHITQTMITTMLQALQTRWEHSLHSADITSPYEHRAW